MGSLSPFLGSLRASVVRGLVVVLAALSLDVDGLSAATITWLSPPPAPATPFSKPAVVENPTLRLTDMIETGDAAKLRQILTRLKAVRPANSNLPLATIELSSIGGSLSEGILIGELLKREGVVAVVREHDLCLSACALALVGGNAYREPPAYPADCNIELGARVAFHNFFLNRNGLREVTSEDPVASRLQGFADARGGAALLVKYAADMELPRNFVANLIGRPVDDFQFIETIDQFLALNICPIGLARPSLPVDQQAINVCRHSAALSLPPSAFQVTPIAPAQAKRYMLERVQEGMRSAKARGRLADQLASWSVMRVKEEIDKLYGDLRAAGVALPDIVGPTFEIGVRQAGTYRPACYISLSSSDPDNYEVVVQGARGLTEPPRTPPDNARRLFLFDREDVVNPRPRDGGRVLRRQEPSIEDPGPMTSSRPLGTAYPAKPRSR